MFDLKKLLKAALIAGGAMTAIKALDTRLEITYETVESKNLPESFDGFKIVHLSDYHNDQVPTLTNEVREEDPDLIVCTGDMADDKGSYRPALALTERLCSVAPVLMVTGNHDLWRTDFPEMEKDMNAAGARFLHNERVYISKNDEKIAVSGIDDPFVCSQKKVDDFIDSAMNELSESDCFEILLFHRANLLNRFADCSYDLILSGHMHGGHVRIPGLGGVAAPRSSFTSDDKMFFPKFFGGRYEFDNTVMIVNRGLGNPTVIPRLFNRPEMIVVTLKHKAKNQ